MGRRFVVMKKREVGGMKVRKGADEKKNRNSFGAANRSVTHGHDIML